MNNKIQLDDGEKKSHKQQWLWFIGLYIVSVLAVGTFAALIKLLIPH